MITEKIKIVMLKRDVSNKTLAARLDIGATNLSNKFSRDNFKTQDLMEIAAALDCRLDIAFLDNETGSRLA